MERPTRRSGWRRSPTRRPSRRLMKESASALFPLFYDEQQAASAVELRRPGRSAAAPGRHLLRPRERRRDGRAAAAGAGATGCTRAAATRTTTPARSTPRPSRRACARCSCAPTGRAEASAAGSSRSARRRRGAKGSAAPCSTPRLPGVPLYVAYGFVPTGELIVTMPDGVRIHCVAMAKAIRHPPERKVSDRADRGSRSTHE